MESDSLAQYFSHDEIERLTRGIPSLSQWSASALVPFIVRRLRAPSVIWTNRQWFLERGFDLSHAHTVSRVNSWLLTEFGWIVDSELNGSAGESRTFWADRYGSPDGMSPHGGSGRVATAGRFQAKGIGRTPLVGAESSVGHAHGCQSVAECFREAIWAEISCAEFPHGAIPVIAILDAGLDFSSPDSADRYDQNVRRGILVRPAVVRPAHAERAPLFKHPVSDFVNRQTEDVDRTREMITFWAATSNSSGIASVTDVLKRCVCGIAEQIAFGQVHRLFSGGYFSSNVSIHGELLDFGNMHALPNWARTQVHSVVPGFGDEMRLLGPMIGSLAFHFTKYLRFSNRNELGTSLLGSATAAYQHAWRQFSLSLFQANRLAPDVQNKIYDALRRYYIEQQRTFMKYRFGLLVENRSPPSIDWIHDALISENFAVDSGESRTLDAIAEALRAHAESRQDYLSFATAARLLLPRPSVERRYLLDTLATAIPPVGSGRSLDTHALGRIVSKTVSSARRTWPRLPPDLAVLGHTARDGSSALLCAQSINGPQLAWLEGICGPTGLLHWFEHRFVTTDFAGFDLHRDGCYWWVLCPIQHVGESSWRVTLPGGAVPLPELDVLYPRPAMRWQEALQTHIS